MRRLLLLSGAIVFVDTMFFVALTPLLPHYAERFELSKAGAGVLAAAYPAGVLAGGIPGGLAATRLGVKQTAIVGLAVIAATSIVFGFADSIVLLDLARFAQGIGSAFAWTAALTWLIAVAPTDRRGALIGSVLGVAIAGALFGPVLGGVASRVGTGPAFTAVAILCAGVAVGALLTEAPSLRESQPVRRVWEALSERRILAGIWLVALPALLFGTQTVLVPLRLSELGYGAVAIGAVYLIAAALEGAASPLVGRISDRRGRRLPITVGLALSAVAAAVLPWPDRGAVLAVVAILAAGAFGMFWPPAMSLLTDTADSIGLELAWAFALVNLAWAPGEALGSVFGGGLAHLTSDAVPYLILSALCLLTLVAVRRG